MFTYCVGTDQNYRANHVCMSHTFPKITTDFPCRVPTNVSKLFLPGIETKVKLTLNINFPCHLVHIKVTLQNSEGFLGIVQTDEPVVTGHRCPCR